MLFIYALNLMINFSLSDCKLHVLFSLVVISGILMSAETLSSTTSSFPSLTSDTTSTTTTTNCCSNNSNGRSLVSLPEIQSFVRVFDHALPAYLLDKLNGEVVQVHKTASKQSLMHNKRVTYFMPFCNYLAEGAENTGIHFPRNSIELSILHLANYVTKSNMYLPVPLKSPHTNHRIVGAEWWVQYKEPGESIDFHYDKDEGYASQKMQMVFPATSSVFYFNDTEPGMLLRPTLVFNQTTIDGNTDVPQIPDLGFLVFPSRNRYFTFRGNLQHGVLPIDPEQGIKQSLQSKKRLTFLVNFWYRTPIEPNCVQLSDGDLANMGLYSEKEMRGELSKKLDVYSKLLQHLRNKPHIFSKCTDFTDGGGDRTQLNTLDELATLPSDKEPFERQFDVLEVPFDSSQTHEYEIEIPPGETTQFLLPKSMSEIIESKLSSTAEVFSSSVTIDPDGSSAKLSESIPDLESGLFSLSPKRNVIAIRWAANQSFGSVGKLDLTNQNQVNHLFNLRQPKAFFIYDGKQKTFLKRLKKVIFPLAKKYLGKIKVYHCPMANCHDILSVFGVGRKQPPFHLIDDNHRVITGGDHNGKYIQEDFPDRIVKNITLSIEDFWNSIGIH